MHKDHKPTGSMNAKEIAREARRLKQKAGWDPEKMTKETPLDRLMQLDQESRNAHVYVARKEVCNDCVLAREEQSDETALCTQHLAEAMGF